MLHDSEYRREWDANVIDSHDIARVAANANVGYYACEWGRGAGWHWPSNAEALGGVNRARPARVWGCLGRGAWLRTAATRVGLVRGSAGRRRH